MQAVDSPCKESGLGRRSASKGRVPPAGGLYRADIVEKNLIDVFVPFLPLERKQVVACVRDEFKRRSRTTNDRTLEEIADELDYIPSDYGLYSSTGCKKIHQKVAQHLGFQEKI
ncbi:hypothetical protein HPB47_028245 [Ixodes persulcatus]|uniref:Uncharacterized protein n=1 Tax=Ixodes persulcatus TaxID=34615 RepID=A0AC60PTU0_IXOPE|nr:hypothetical protein HPB47_028245 [Ixodes persulcatus]